MTTLEASTKARSIKEQEALDGSDVVAYLSQPDDWESLPVEEPEELTVSEIARLQDALFGSGSTWPFWDQLLNFSPDFVASTAGSDRSAEMHMGTTDTELARSIWLKQWNDVLSSYTDEVWGDLGPLTTAVKRELQECTQTEVSQHPSTTALSRLRLILSHVRGH
jgi:hypothetical protein